MDNYNFEEKAYIFVIRAADGHYLGDAQQLDHGDANKKHTVLPSGMYFDSYGLVYMAHSFVGSTRMDADNSAFTNYASKLAVSAYNTNTNAMEFYWH